MRDKKIQGDNYGDHGGHLIVPSTSIHINPRSSTISRTVSGFLYQTLILFFSLHEKKLLYGKLGVIPNIGESVSFLRAHRLDKTIEWIQNHAAKYGPIF